MDQIAAMRAFVRVVEAGTFTRAADLLDMPKPTLTKLVQQLEAHLRTQLLNRTTRRVGVTPDGAAYYERAVSLLNDLDELDGSMARLQASPQGRLRVDVGTALALHIIIPAMADFHERYPDIQVDLGVSDRPVDLIGENVDVAVRGGELLDPALIARRVTEIELVTCATPAYLARHGEPRHPSELETGHRAVGFFSPRTGRDYPFSFRRGEEHYELALPHMLSVNDSLAYVASGVTGLGIAQLPSFMVRDQLAAGTLKRILADWKAETIAIYVVYSPNRHLSSRLRVFVDWLAEIFSTSTVLQGG